MLAIGLTGGIGSGKSTVAKLFAELDVPIIDADVVAREVVQPNRPALQQIQEHFGVEILNELGELDRTALRKHIFDKPEDKKWLEQLLHPIIRQEMKEKVQGLTTPYCILVIPLLFESKPNPLIDRVLVIDSPVSLQIERTQQRDGCDEEMVRAIMKSQVSREERLKRADDVIHNDKDLPYLTQQVHELHKKYLKLANLS